MKLTENSLNMTADISDGIVADDLRLWLCENDTELDIATALAQANMKVGWLMHDLNDPDTEDLSRAEDAYEEWRALYIEIKDKVVAILKDENDSGKAHHNLAENRFHYLVMSFMERNGYRDGSGWWVRE